MTHQVRFQGPNGPRWLLSGGVISGPNYVLSHALFTSEPQAWRTLGRLFHERQFIDDGRKFLEQTERDCPILEIVVEQYPDARGNGCRARSDTTIDGVSHLAGQVLKLYHFVEQVKIMRALQIECFDRESQTGRAAQEQLVDAAIVQILDAGQQPHR